MASTNPRIIFCTTAKGRTQHLAATLPRNIADNADYENCAFVVLDYCDPGPLRQYLWANHRGNMKSGRLAVYSYLGTPGPADPIPALSNREQPIDTPFHMAHAKNMGHRCGILEGADILVTLDADNFTGPGFARYIADNLTPGSYLCPDFELIKSLPWGPDRPGRGYYGRLAIRSQDFIKLGGYDHKFDTWCGEDTDILARLKRAGLVAKTFTNKSLNVIRHDASVRFKEYPHAQEMESEEKANELLRAIDSSTATVVNDGVLGLGTLFRNFDPNPVELKPIPTRVFGIGMHRTATTSLYRAFQVLGFDSFHFNTGNEARLIWQQMNIAGRSAELEKWYSLCDLPIPLLYEKLDRAYPGSKFVLTVRDEEKWLASVERLWSPEHNPERWTWDVYPISHNLHTALYGRRDFNRDVFLARYRRHNAEVREHFKDRPNDLLVMDIDAGVGWPALCRFLGVPLPSVPYPNESHMKKEVRLACSADFEPPMPAGEVHRWAEEEHQKAVAIPPEPEPSLHWTIAQSERFEKIFDRVDEPDLMPTEIEVRQEGAHDELKGLICPACGRETKADIAADGLPGSRYDCGHCISSWALSPFGDLWRIASEDEERQRADFGPTEELRRRRADELARAADRIFMRRVFMFVLVALILVVAVVAAWNHWK